MNKNLKLRYRIMAILLAVAITTSLMYIVPVKAVEQNSITYYAIGYEVKFQITSQWDSGYNANVVITNTSTETIDNWAIGFNMQNEIKNIWDGKIASCEGNYYVIKNAGYNQDITPNGSVSFGFTAKLDTSVDIPELYDLLSYQMVVDDSRYSVEFVISSDWTSAYNGELIITNKSEKIIEDWMLEMDFDSEVSQFWTAQIVSHDGEHYIIKNVGYNANIEPGQSVRLGFSASSQSSIRLEPQNYRLHEIEIKFEPIDLNLDTDNDGIPDYDEQRLGTDMCLTDSDEDGLDDYWELCFGYSPILKDTDENGINDGAEDYDKDTLNNVSELEMGSDPACRDTDEDGLSDAEEINLYGTYVNDSDTDDDGVLDGSEIQYGFNPFKKDTDDDTIIDADETVSQTYDASQIMGYYDEVVYPTIELTGNSNIQDTFTMDVSDNSAIFNIMIPGYIGEAYEFETEGDFDSAKVTFHVDESLFVDENFYPAIYYYNEDLQLLEYVENQMVEGNTVSAELEHFSTYIVLNKTDFDKVWEEEIVYVDENEQEKPLDIAFVIDASGSMSYDAQPKNDKNGLRLELSKQMVKKLSENDRGMVIQFSTNVVLLQSLTSDKTKIVEAINKIASSGKTSMRDGIKEANDNFIEYSDDLRRKIMIVITDGLDNKSTYSTDYIINQAKDNNIVIYTVGLGSDLDVVDLKRIASETGGKYYYASVAEDLEDVYGEIENVTLDVSTDSNNDGISDYYTKLMCDGKLLTGAGVNVFPGATYEEVQSSDDYDEDGLKNGEEIKIVETPTQVYVEKVADPTTAYSDTDFYDDYTEVKLYKSKPLENNLIMDGPIVDAVCSDMYYYACYYEKAYFESEAKQVAVWIGNKVYGSNYFYEEIYKDLLVDYFEEINGISAYKNELLECAKIFQEYYSELEKIVKNELSQIKEYEEVVAEELKQLENQIEHIKASIVDLVSSIETGNVTRNSFYEQYDKLQGWIRNSSDDLNKILDRDIKVKRVINILDKASDTLVLTEKVLDKGLRFIGALDDLLSVVGVTETIQDNMYILELLKEKAYYEELRYAANILLTAGENIWLDAVEEIWGIGKDMGIDYIADMIIKRFSKVGFWAQLSISISDIAFSYSDISLSAVRICADACIGFCLANDLRIKLTKRVLLDNDVYIYSISRAQITDVQKRYENLVEIRKLGEKDMITLQKQETNLLQELIGFDDDSDAIIEFCKATIKTLDSYKHPYMLIK